MAFYRHKPNNQDPGEVGGANAPPNSLTMPRKCGFCRVSTARVWPGGHTLLVELLGFAFLALSSVGFLVYVRDCDEMAFSLASTDRFWEDSSQPVFNLLIVH